MIKELIVKNKPKSPISEAYRGARTNMLFANVDESFKSVLFTSATAGEGKTTSLCNVAATLVDSGKRVIILDCDLRKPRIHKFFNVSNAKGLSELLMEKGSVEGYLLETEVKGLQVLTAGAIPSNPSELLSSERFKTVIETLKEKCDYLFVDTPPVLPVTDALILSSVIERVVLVCSAKGVERAHAIKAKENLESVEANVLGVILNKVPVERKQYQNYYYYKED